MSKQSLTNKAPKLRSGVFVAATLIGGLLLAGCGDGGGADDAQADEAAVTAAADSDEATDAAEWEDHDPAGAADSPADQLPDGFPEDVPLPGYSASHTISAPTDDYLLWVVLLELVDDTDTPMEDYSAILEDAGYTLEDGMGSSVIAEGPVWEIDFHSPAANTLSVGVSES